MTTRRFVDAEEHFSAGTPGTTAPHLLTIMWRRKLIIVTSVIVVLAAGWIAFKKITPQFNSEAKLHVSQPIPLVGAVGNQPVAAALPTFSVGTQFEIIKSTAVLEQAVASPELKSLALLKRVADPIAFLQAALQVTAGRADEIILVGIQSDNPNDAATIVNAVTMAYRNYNAQQQLAASTDVLRMLHTEKESRETEATRLKDSLDKLRRESGIVTLDAAKGSYQEQQVANLSEQLGKVQLDVTNAQIIAQRFEELRNLPDALKAFITNESPSLGFNSNTMVSALDQERSRLQAELRELEAGSAGPQHPRVVQIRKLLDTDVGDGSSDTQYADAFRLLNVQRLETAKKFEAELTSQLHELESRALDLSGETREFRRIDHEYDQAINVVAGLDEQIRNVEREKSSRTGSLDISVLDAAKADAVPVSPKKGKILGLALVAGLALGVSLAVIRDLLDQRLRSLEEIEDTLGSRILGTVPTLGKRVHPMIAGKTVDTRPVSDVAEAYRTIRTSLFMARSQPVPRTILVTSAMAGEGKSTTISNLAIAAAQLNRRVLLIDADCRMPSLHLIFKVADGLERGLASILSGESTAANTIRPSGVANLDILTCGPLSGRPAEMLNSRELRDLLKDLSTRYDHIFIDSPPVVPVSDARILTPLCDVTILVIRAERSTRRQSLRARDALENVGGRLFGVVVNDAPRRRAQYGIDFDLYPIGDDRKVDSFRDDRPSRRKAVRRVTPVLADVKAVAGNSTTLAADDEDNGVDTRSTRSPVKDA